ncbi:MAG: DeoR/GlpR family DNA-binding transcription regulator [Thermocrispum sp.]
MAFTSDAQQERQRTIRQLVTEHGHVRSDVLAARFEVSLMTVHRDLDTLQSQGWLRKIRGGATALPSVAFHGDVGQRMSAMAETKRKLARAAIDLVRPGQKVMIDDSTTCLCLAQRLGERAPLTVITNFFAVQKLLAAESGVTLIGLGGTYFAAYDAFLGLHTAQAVTAYRADVVFMSTTAITRGRCYHQSEETVAVKRAMMEAAIQRVLVVDHTKFTRDGVYSLASLTEFDTVIVDSGIPREEQRALRELDVRLITV